MHHLGQVQLVEAEATLHSPGKEGEYSTVRRRSTELPEHATMSALVETTDSSRDNDPNSPVRSVAGS